MTPDNQATPKCALCGEPMPEGESMFNFHGYSGPCPKPPKTKTTGESGAAPRVKIAANIALDAKKDGLWLMLEADGNHAAINVSQIVRPDGIAAKVVKAVHAQVEKATDFESYDQMRGAAIRIVELQNTVSRLKREKEEIIERAEAAESALSDAVKQIESLTGENGDLREAAKNLLENKTTSFGKKNDKYIEDQSGELCYIVGHEAILELEAAISAPATHPSAGGAGNSQPNAQGGEG